MNKIAHYLQEHLVGEVFSDDRTLDYFSTDRSIFSIRPSFVVYPMNESDVRKAARFSWQLADRGRDLGITSRGFGTDESGSAIGEGMIMAFAAHMNNLIDLDQKSGEIKAQPGCKVSIVQQALNLRGDSIPPFDRCLMTIGGAIANNHANSSSFKYGSLKHYVTGLRVVLANGDVILTGRLSKKQVNKKMGEGGSEAKIYREVDKLIEENQQLINGMTRSISLNNAGYDIGSVKAEDGSFDLTPLFVGSQGTLGLITEATLASVPKQQNQSLIVAKFESFSDAQDVGLEIAIDEERPASIEVVDGNVLQFVHENYPNQLKDVISSPFPKLTMLIELDGAPRQIKKQQKRIQKLLSKRNIEHSLITDYDEVLRQRKISNAYATFLHQTDSKSKALPIINDGVVPLGRVNNFINMVYELFAENNLKPYLWGNFGDGHLQVRPLLDLAEVPDRQKVFRLLDSFNDAVIAMGGSISGSRGDGRLRAPYLQMMYGDANPLFERIKNIFDPKNLMNPGVKLGVDPTKIKRSLRKDFNSARNLEYLD